uniref:BAR/IMD domain-containing adapter protein 2-like 1 n=1 Tax=Geotrypetes seraphini TaxID=260995 RepID=A0A6P8SJG7_GEOSA|nr:brain-specific angiogenesis inhibitor 1-associated protein 2-like protein 1 isoform X2 [Geotrypetes seraphini]
MQRSKRSPESKPERNPRTTDNVMEQFNPGLRNLINLGKNYEKAVSAMVQAGRAYYDGVAKVGEMTTVSPVSKDLGQVLVEISNTHKRLNENLDESFKKFHKEIISELERKTDQDVKYMNATLKRYQIEHRSKLDSLERSQSDLKKLRRKSQGGRNPIKYEHKETECMETIVFRQSDIQKFIAEGCKEALLEEKRRFCFLVDKHCNFTNHLNYYHSQAAELLNSKLPKWQETCSDSIKVPDTVMNIIQDIKTPATTPVSGTPQPSPMVERNHLSIPNYDTLSRSSPKLPPAPTSKAHTSPLVDMFNNPSTVQKASYEKPSNPADVPDETSLLRSMSMATGLNLVKRTKVKTIFPHTAGNNKTLLSFTEGDILTLLIPEEKDGWLYGEHDKTKMRGWFPSSYTRILEEPVQEQLCVPSPVSVRSISSINLTDKGSVVLPPPDYQELTTSIPSDKGFDSYSNIFRNSPMPGPESSPPKPNANGIMKPPFLSGENPFATVKLRPTVTNDRSAPII